MELRFIDCNASNKLDNIMTKRRERLNEVVHASGLTLVELGNLTGVAKSSIQRYLTGATKKIPIDFFDKIAYVTGTSFEYLICLDFSKKEKKEGSDSFDTKK